MPPATLRATLKQLGLSPTWLARQCGRSARTGHGWVRGEQVIAAEVGAWVLRRLAQSEVDPPPRLPPRIDWPQTCNAKGLGIAAEGL